MSARFCQACQPQTLRGSDREPSSGPEGWQLSPWSAMGRWHGMAMLRHVRQQGQDRPIEAGFENIDFSLTLTFASYVLCSLLFHILLLLTPEDLCDCQDGLFIDKC